MAKVNTETSNTDLMRQHQLKRGGNTGKSDLIKEVELGVEEASGTRVFEFRVTKCLNARSGPARTSGGSQPGSGADETAGGSTSSQKLPATIQQILVPQEDNPCLISDADNQLLLNIVFAEKVNLSAITFRCDERPTKELCGDDDLDDFQPPQNVHIFVNLETLDFQDIEDYPTLERKELEWDIEGGKTTNKIVLAGPKFQRAQSLQIFIVDAKDDAQFTFLNHVGITGTIAPDYHTK